MIIYPLVASISSLAVVPLFAKLCSMSCPTLQLVLCTSGLELACPVIADVNKTTSTVIATTATTPRIVSRISLSNLLTVLFAFFFAILPLLLYLYGESYL